MNTYFYTPNIDDAEEMHNIEKISFSENEVVPFDFYTSKLKSKPESFICLVDEDKNKIAGFICFILSSHKFLDDDIFFTKDAVFEENAKNAIILCLVVHPDYRGQGFSQMLMEEAIDDFYDLNIKHVSLTCHDYLLPFYEKFGFKDIGISKSKFGNVVWHDMLKEL